MSWTADDVEDDLDPLGRQVLPIANLPDDFNGDPEDGMQYLFMVRRDARTLANVTSVPNPYPTPTKPPAPSPPDLTTLDSSILPSQEWCDQFELRLKNIRRNVKQPTIHVGEPSTSRRTPIPPTLDRALWWAFLEGKPEKEWNPPKRSKRQEKRVQEREMHDRPKKKMRMDEVELARQDLAAIATEGNGVTQVACKEEEVVPENTQEWNGKESYKPREATLTIISQLYGRQPLQLLRSFTYWINHRSPSEEEPEALAYPINISHARWIFSLLTVIDSQLTSEDISILRELARACLSLIQEDLSQARSGSGLKERAPWWMIVAAVVGLWGQKDLWMDAQDMVRKLQRKQVL